MQTNCRHHFYNELARFYDGFYEAKDYKGEVEYFYDIFKHFDNIETGNILDVGCGTGSHLLQFSSYFENLYGVDPNKPMLDIARNKLRANSHFFIKKIQEYDSKPIFDLIVSFNSTLNYLSSCHELNLAFKKIFAALSNHGVAIVQLHNCRDKDFLACRVSYDGDDKLIIVGDWLKRNSYGPHSIDFFYHLCSRGTWASYHDVHEEYFFTKDEINDAMAGAGFSAISIRETDKCASPFKTSEYICSGRKRRA